MLPSRSLTATRSVPIMVGPPRSGIFISTVQIRSPDILDAYTSVDINDIVIHIPEDAREEGDPDIFRVESYSLQGGVEAYPLTADARLRSLFKEYNNYDQTKPVNIVKLKKGLMDFIQQMAANNTRLYLNDLNLTAGDLATQMSGELRFDSELKPVGNVSVQISGLKEFMQKRNLPLPNMPEPPKVDKKDPMAAARPAPGLSPQQMIIKEWLQTGDLQVSVQAADGTLSLNGRPLFPIPPIGLLLQLMPNELNPVPVMPSMTVPGSQGQ